MKIKISDKFFFEMGSRFFFTAFVRFIQPLFRFPHPVCFLVWFAGTLAPYKAYGIEVSGYVKDLRTLSVPHPDSLQSSGLIHNRINLAAGWKDWNGALELRNRLFYGSGINPSGALSRSLQDEQPDLPLYASFPDQESVLGHGEIDRLYIDHTLGKLEWRLGRQRIHWGINTVWNPNDLFNVYRFTDFDYEERPGRDALRLEYYTSPMSSFQVAAAYASSLKDFIAAGLYRWNLWEYDFQILGGAFQKELVLGGGWAGNLYNAGFKGEASWFLPETDIIQHPGVVNAALSLDYFFEKPVYLLGAFLFNSRGVTSPDNISANLVSTPVSPKNLMPTQYTALTQIAWTFHPLWSFNQSVLYAFGVDVIFWSPALTFSLHDNWDLMLLGQTWYAFQETGEANALLGNQIFMRLKWSF